MISFVENINRNNYYLRGGHNEKVDDRPTCDADSHTCSM